MMTHSDRICLEGTALFLVPLLAAYGGAMVLATGVSWADYRGVLTLFSSAALGIGAVLYLCCRTAAKVTGRGDLLSWDHMAWAILGGICLVGLQPSFGAFKQLLLPERGFALDPFLAAFGRTALGGTSPWVLTHKLFGTVWPTLILDRLYTFWTLLFMAFPLLVPFVTSDRVRRAQMLIAWVLAWLLIGTLAAWLLGSAGPIFYNDLVGSDPDFRLLTADLKRLSFDARRLGFEVNNIDFKATLLQAQASGRYTPAGGISAMPSMHVAMATLIALSGRAVARPLGNVLAGYGVLIWLASIHFGWHYAVDGPVAVLMMLATWRLAGAIAGTLAGDNGRLDSSLGQEICSA